jgi:hypothetical protein
MGRENILSFDIKYCKCGCGQIVKVGNKFINGHNWKNKKRQPFSTEHKQKISKKLSGRRLSKEHREKVILNLNRKGLLGKKQTQEHKIKRGLYKTGKEHPRFNKHHTQKTKDKISKSNMGKKRSEEFKKKRSEQFGGKNNPFYGKGYLITGKKHWNWQGGKTEEKYPKGWNRTFKNSIRERDDYTCQLCGITQNNRKPDVHHIDYDKNNLNPKNLITLCRSDNSKVNYNREYWKTIFNRVINEKYKNI